MAARKQEAPRDRRPRGHGHQPRQGLLPEGRAHQARPRPLLPRRRRRRAGRASAAGRWRSSASSTAPRRSRSSRSARRTTGPTWIRTATLTFPSGRTADEVVVDDAAGPRLGRQPRLPRPQPAPGPRRRPGPPRRAARRPRPGARRALVAGARRGARDRARRSRRVGLVGWPKTSGSRGIHINVRIEPRWTYPQVRRAALALARDVERRAPSIATSKWWKEERHGVFLDYNQNAKDRTVASAYSVRPTARRPGLVPAALGRGADVVMEDFTLATVPAIYAERGRRRARGSTTAVGSLDALLELSARHEAEGEGDAPWPPNYAKQEGEPPRVQPSRKRRADDGVRRAGARTAGRRRRSPRPSGRRRRRGRPERRPARPSGRARARRRPVAASRTSR